MASLESVLKARVEEKIATRPDLVDQTTQEIIDMREEVRSVAKMDKKVWGRVLAMAMVVADMAHEKDIYANTLVDYNGYALRAWQIPRATLSERNRPRNFPAKRMILTRGGILFETSSIGQVLDNSQLQVLDDSDFTRLGINPNLAASIEKDLISFAESHGLQELASDKTE